MIADEDCIEGDFAIVKVSGKGRVKHFIARIDAIDDDQSYEDVFLKKIASKTAKTTRLLWWMKKMKLHFPKAT